MPITTLHLSSENSISLGNGHHELTLSPGLMIPHDARPSCYLHDLSFTNTVCNIHKQLYGNATFEFADTEIDYEAKEYAVGVKNGAYSVAELERAIVIAFMSAHTTTPSKGAPAEFGTTKLKWASYADPFDTGPGSTWTKAPTIAQQMAGGTTGLPKFVTIEPDLTANRIRICYPERLSATENSTLMLDFLGFTTEQMHAPGGTRGQLAANTARVDRARAICLHVPSIVSGVYSSKGELGGSQMAFVPIEAEIGRSQAWSCSVPIKLSARIAGSLLDRVVFYVASEDGDVIDMQGERYDAVVVVEW